MIVFNALLTVPIIFFTDILREYVMRIISGFLFSLLSAPLLLTPQFANAEPVAEQQAEKNVLAIVLKTRITRADVMPSEKERKEIKAQAKESYGEMLNYLIRVNASNRIYELVLNDYAAQKGITLNQALVSKFTEKFGDQFSGEGASKSIEEVAAKQVMQYQAEKAMFKEFGGRVIFRQSNPQMPIDAYKALLSGYRESGQLQIVDKDLEDAFWSVFTPPFQYEIAPENIDFSQPWWI